jgi:hypothetical protein
MLTHGYGDPELPLIVPPACALPKLVPLEGPTIWFIAIRGCRSALIALVEWGIPTDFGSNEGVRSSDGQQASTQADAVPFGTICSEFGAIGCNAVSMNATRSSHFLSLAKRSGSLSGSGNQCSKAGGS